MYCFHLLWFETCKETESRTIGAIIKSKTFTRKEQVLEAALDEFIANDYEKASLNTIIKNSGISKGVFYYHFENKEALYLFLLQASAQAKWAYINEQAKNNQTDFSEMDIFEKFLYQAELGAGFASQHPKFHALSMMFSKEKGNKIYETAIKALGGDSQAMITDMIRQAIANQELDPRFEEKFIIKVMSHLLIEFDQIFDEESDHTKEKTLQNLREYVDFMKYGFKAQ